MRHPVFQHLDHRPWPLPAERHVMQMSWHNLLFAHWPVPVEVLRQAVPRELPLDTFHGAGWIGVVPFEMSGVRLNGLPAFPGTGRFPEIYLRTYIVRDGKPGVYFFSLDAGSWMAVKAARAWYRLPYFHARISCREAEGEFDYTSERIVRAREAGARFAASYKPLGPAQSDPLAHWLTERYCLYTYNRNASWMADIHHDPWPLQMASAEIRENTMTSPLDITLPDTTPVLHFAPRLDVVAWSPRRL